MGVLKILAVGFVSWKGGGHGIARLLGSFAFVATFVTTPVLALAADIRAEPPRRSGGPAFILIDGEINSGDDDKFRKIAAEYSDAIVVLNSDGGVIGPAMDIGRTIKLRGYKTAIYKTGTCASACALIWVAGSQRVIFEGGEVGFHASYLDTDGVKLETGVGNALVGHYLSQLGFSEKTVVFAALAPPDKILWLNEETASISGIDFDTIPDDEEPQAPKVAARQRTQPPNATPAVPVVPPRQAGDASVGKPSDYGQFMGDAKQTLRIPDAFARALQEKGYRAKLSYDKPETPSILTSVGGGEIQISFSSCDKEGCNYIQLLDFYNDISAQEKSAVLSKAHKEENYSHPLWLEDTKIMAFYNYIVIGSDGITAQTLIDNMEYFVRSNNEILQVVTDMRER